MPGSKGGRFPKLERIRRLDVVVAVAEHSGLAGRMKPVGVDQRMLGCWDDLNVFESCALQTFGYKPSGTGDIVLVFGKGADTRDT